MKRKAELKLKYKRKVAHLETERRIELEKKRKAGTFPNYLEMFKQFIVFNETKLLQLAESKIDGLVIGQVELDDDEIAILKLNPKFPVMSKLVDDEVECEIQLAIFKLRYEKARKAELESLESTEYEKLNEKKLKLIDKEEKEAETDEDAELDEAREMQIFDPIGKVF